MMVRPGLSASFIVGFNAVTPLQMYSTSGTYQGDFGPSGASAGVVEGNLLYLAQPDTSGLTVSTVSALNSVQQTVNSFSLPVLISDEAPGTSNTLWLSAYDGTIYHVSTAGQILASFSTGFQNIGIAAGGFLYTTEGDASDGIDVRTLDGTVISTIHTGYTSLYGIGIDPSDSTFYIGTFSDVYHLNKAGALIDTLNLPGDSRTPNGAVHGGLEVADLSSLSAGTPVPESSKAALMLLALLLAGAIVLRRRVSFSVNKVVGGVFSVTLLATVLQAEVSVTLNASASTVSVGDSVSLIAQAANSSNGGASFSYQFSVSPGGAGDFHVVKDFYSDNTLVWSPTEQEGSYEVRVIARSSTGSSQTAVQTITAISHVIGTSPVVTATSHPLVALYSAPPCSADQQVRVRFRDSNTSVWQLTPFKSCTGLSVNFLIAGMKPNTTYSLQQDVYRGPFNKSEAPISFRTGAIPSTVSIPDHFMVTPQQAPTSLSYPLVWRTNGVAYDDQDNVVWYIPSVSPGNLFYFMRAVSGGTFSAVVSRTDSVCPQTGQLCADSFFLREYDLAGNLIRETNADRLNESINALAKVQGKQPVNLKFINHEGYRLPNGYTATLVENEQVADQGGGPQDVFGDVVVVLDQNFQVAWYWNSFDHLDIKRTALLQDTCQPGQLGCPIITNRLSNGQYYSVANDWTHCN